MGVPFRSSWRGRGSRLGLGRTKAEEEEVEIGEQTVMVAEEAMVANQM